ncbi:hypothetical protein PVAP13_9KG088900 [Panicum virgatum]|uniref:Uncharacterized protein n=1 Tax=Panicum virgatum TaxID=38727 RepID=A0A8T0NVF7_PANVG|nr:hypothetical protein PVAP13_9KG088900 [Panicum virgatum]
MGKAKVDDGMRRRQRVSPRRPPLLPSPRVGRRAPALLFPAPGETASQHTRPRTGRGATHDQGQGAAARAENESPLSEPRPLAGATQGTGKRRSQAGGRSRRSIILPHSTDQVERAALPATRKASGTSAVQLPGTPCGTSKPPEHAG